MQPVRQILFNAPDVVAVPPELRHQSIEVIFWPLNETKENKPPFNAESVIDDIRRLIAQVEPVELGEFQLDLTGFHFDREEANAR
jgi:hypothetical protein